MKNLVVIAITLAFSFIHVDGKDLFAAKPPLRDLSSELLSQEENDFASFEEVRKPLRDHNKRVQPPKFNDIGKKRNDAKLDMGIDMLFTRPSADELEEYGRKVEQQKMMKDDHQYDVMKPHPTDKDQAKNLQNAIKKMDENEQHLVMAAFDQMLLNNLEDEKVAKKIMQPPMPLNYEDEDYEHPYFFEVSSDEEPKTFESKNNNNGNVNVNVNHVNVESTIVGVKVEGKDKKDVPPPPPPSPVPEPSPFRVPDYFPTSVSHYYYLNMNLTDSILFIGVCAFLVFVVRKTYLWIKKTPAVPAPAPQQHQPTSFSPPTYTPSAVVVETVKKVVPQ